MGAGQIGGIATLLDIDFDNAAGFVGVNAEGTEAHFVTHYLSHAMLFCVGTLLEAHVVLTPASCVYGERHRFDVFGGTHNFLDHMGSHREVQHFSVHRAYNHSSRWTNCVPENLALLVLGQDYQFTLKEQHTEYTINRLRYGMPSLKLDALAEPPPKKACQFYGWGSRRNGFLLPLLIHLRRVDVVILPAEKCFDMWNYKNKFLCLSSPPCRSDKYGALCPDDLGTVLVCDGFLKGMMVSLLMDRPCGVGFLDMGKYHKFLTCAVDDSHDVLLHGDHMSFDYQEKPESHYRVVHINSSILL